MAPKSAKKRKREASPSPQPISPPSSLILSSPPLLSSYREEVHLSRVHVNKGDLHPHMQRGDCSKGKNKGKKKKGKGKGKTKSINDIPSVSSLTRGDANASPSKRARFLKLVL